MRHLVHLTAMRLRADRLQTVMLVAGVAITLFLPLTVNRLVAISQADLLRRAASTPLVAGGTGSRYDLVLHALYFRGSPPRQLNMADVDAMRATGYAEPVPLHVARTARGLPLVGTTPDYFPMRGLAPEKGELPLLLGDCVLGAAAARQVRLGPGDRILTDPDNVFDLAGALPLRMRVTGVLGPSGGPDDRAVFTDIKTAWVAAGLGHGHEDVTRADADPGLLLARTSTNVTANAALAEFQEITPANAGGFHFHGDPTTFPVTAILPVCPDAKSRTLLRGRYLAADARAQVLVPDEVVREILGVVFRIKRYFDANALLVAVSTALFLALVFMLSTRLRRSELLVMHHLGCARGLLARLLLIELAVILAASSAIALALSELTLRSFLP